MPWRHLHHRTQRSATKDWKSALRQICTRTFLVVTAINLLVMTAYYLTFVAGVPYVRETFQVSLSLAGLTSGIMVIGVLTGRFFAGNLVSRLGCAPILLAGLVAYSAMLFACLQAGHIATLLVTRFLLGLTVGFVSTATGTIVANEVPVAHRGFGISLFSLSTALALALGPFFGILLTQVLSFPTLMSLNLGLGLACVGLYFCAGGAWPKTLHHPRPLFALASYIDVRVVPFACTGMLLGLGYGCVQTFMASHAANHDLTGAASLYFLVFCLATISSRPLTGRLFDQFGENRIIPPLFVLTALALFVLACATNEVFFLLSGLLLGLGFGNFQSIGQAVSLAMVTPSRFAQATTTFFMIFDLGTGMGPSLFGSLVPCMGFEGMYKVLSCVTLAALVLYYLVHGRKLHFVD